MKFLKSRFAYPLAAFCLVISTFLQVIWLFQIFNAQQIKLKEDLDMGMGNAAKHAIYASLIEETNPLSKYKEFFLSPEWLNLKLALDNAGAKGLTKIFSYDVSEDSAMISLTLQFNHKLQIKDKKNNPDNFPITPKMQSYAAYSLKYMNHAVDSMLYSFHIYSLHYYRIYHYSNNLLVSSTYPSKADKLSYYSGLYSYNLQHLRKYQLLVPSLAGAVLYRMRFYLISSSLMILLTSATFYFILKLLKSQLLYANARIAFTSNMTHELKTPVATVALALESIVKYKLTDEPVKLNDYLEISQHELQRLNLMIDKVLNLDQTEHGELPLIEELYDVQTGIDQVISSLQLQLRQNGSDVSFEASEIPCFVNGDPVHLTNVFYNLIENALKYGGRGVKLFVRCKCVQDRIIISFKDNGPGIALIYQKRIFERFFRVQNNENIHNVKGTGLGLYYVQQIVLKHNGTISLKSDLNKGSDFIINLPAAT
ncbi:sensor histidine kinase [Mucilaginibacter sp. E4BP6]|uniref:sensor histidine kinase n=1 Tax=Mucilaginibacter sp. E4BP6 TaxID=2723089 RepID=UPI0015CA8E41|nr:HAMP domain-containing sensor histidine kinase [Mucilaginibacter sp. E4BP6]NYE64951.1 signal transduction histidine kinase [Mucilaginibacter sp. E4BP6]